MIIISDNFGNPVNVSHFAISTGDKSGYYTLRAYGARVRHFRDDEGNTSTEADDASVYIKNLSINKAQALEAARAYLSENYPTARFHGVVSFDLDEIARISREESERRAAAEAARVASTDFSVFQTGKYAGRSVQDVLAEDKGYCEWFSNNGFKSDTDSGRTAAIINALLAPSREVAKAAAQTLASAILEEIDTTTLENWYKGFAGGFLCSVSTALLQGHAPKGRALHILIECIAKNGNRKGSKAYNARYDALAAKFCAE